MNGVDGFYAALGVALPGEGQEARVPCFANPDAHARGDRDPSASVNRETGAWICFACGASGGPLDAAIALGRSHADARALLSEHGVAGGGGEPAGSHAHLPTSPVPGCTLAEYAAVKHLPEGFLRRMGLTEMSYLSAPAVRIPYLGEGGEELAVRFRTALHKADGGPDGRFRWKKGARPTLYGLWGIDEAQKAGRVVLVEGESDTQTLIYHGIPALGLPGASMWKEQWADNFDGIGVVFVTVEPDTGGRALIEKLSTFRIRERVRLVVMPTETPDPSALHQVCASARTSTDGDAPPRVGFPEKFEELLKGAIPWTEHARIERRQQEQESWKACSQVAQLPDILARLTADVRRSGLVGEERAVKLLFLVVVSRHLDKPVSAFVKGTSSAGKSFVVERVLSFMSSDAAHILSASSEHTLAYSDEPIAHRMLVILEATGLGGDLASYLMRSLLSEGCIRYETVEKTKEGLRARVIEREGPTGLITTTTRISLHPENETRALSIPVNDSPAQTAAILLALAEQDGIDPVDRGPWHALDRWTGARDKRVTIPYARSIATLVPAVSVRLRRDFEKVLTLIKAHALLHQVSRTRDKDGRIVAEIEDYRAVHALVADLISEGVGHTVRPEMRETVEAVRRLVEARTDAAPVRINDLAKELGLDRSATGRRVRAAIDAGYLRDTSERSGRGRPVLIALGDPLPGETMVLPTAAEVEAATTGPTDPTDHSGPDDDGPPAMLLPRSPLGPLPGGGHAEVPTPAAAPAPSGAQGSSDDHTAAVRVTESLPGAGPDTHVLDLPGGPLTVERLGPGASRERWCAFEAWRTRTAESGASMGFDTETTGLDIFGSDRSFLRLAQFSDGTTSWVLDMRDETARGAAVDVLRHYPGSIVCHNLQFDGAVAARHLGVSVHDLGGRVVDTMILGHLVDPPSRVPGRDEESAGHPLKGLATRFLGAGADSPEVMLDAAFRDLGLHGAARWAQIPAEHPAYWGYAGADAALCARLVEPLRARLPTGVASDELVAKEMRVALITLRAGIRGWLVDADYASSLDTELATEIDHLATALQPLGIHGADGERATREIHLALEREGYRMAGMSLRREILEPLAAAGSDVARLVLALRRARKYRSTYARRFLEVAASGDGRVHALTNTLGTFTGRMTISAGVPLHQLPRSPLEASFATGNDGAHSAAAGQHAGMVRSCLVAEEGDVTLTVDFDRMELVLAAALSGDSTMRDALESSDMHAATARQLFATADPTPEQRSRAKTLNFALMYGAGADSVTRMIGVDRSAAEALIALWWGAFPALRDLRDTVARGRDLTTYWGRPLPVRPGKEHARLNHLIQGSGRDVFCQGLLALEDADLDQHLVLALHDEYVLTAPTAEAEEVAREVARLARCRINDLTLEASHAVGGRSWGSVRT